MKSQKTLIILETQNLSDHIKDRLRLNENLKYQYIVEYIANTQL